MAINEIAFLINWIRSPKVDVLVETKFENPL